MNIGLYTVLVAIAMLIAIASSTGHRAAVAGRIDGLVGRFSRLRSRLGVGSRLRGLALRARSIDPSIEATLHDRKWPDRPRSVDRTPGTGRVNACLVIPIYDHASTIRGVVESLASADLPLLIVDDGSGPDTQATLDGIARDFDWIEIRRHAVNQGKGTALVTGFRAAAELGFTHAIQLDADAQHESADVGRFLTVAREKPDSLVLGQPVFGADVPKSRLYGRKLSVGLVWLATLSREVRDPLCGFRCVPLSPVLHLVDRVSMGRRMDFEPELAVRLIWMGVPVSNVATRVRYFPGGISHFDVIWDDLRLAWLYTRLGIGMLAHAPELLRRRKAGPEWT